MHVDEEMQINSYTHFSSRPKANRVYLGINDEEINKIRNTYIKEGKLRIS